MQMIVKGKYMEHIFIIGRGKVLGVHDMLRITTWLKC